MQLLNNHDNFQESNNNNNSFETLPDLDNCQNIEEDSDIVRLNGYFEKDNCSNFLKHLLEEYEKNPHNGTFNIVNNQNLVNRFLDKYVKGKTKKEVMNNPNSMNNLLKLYSKVFLSLIPNDTTDGKINVISYLPYTYWDIICNSEKLKCFRNHDNILVTDSNDNMNFFILSYNESTQSVVSQRISKKSYHEGRKELKDLKSKFNNLYYEYFKKTSNNNIKNLITLIQMSINFFGESTTYSFFKKFFIEIKSDTLEEIINIGISTFGKDKILSCIESYIDSNRLTPEIMSLLLKKFEETKIWVNIVYEKLFNEKCKKLTEYIQENKLTSEIISWLYKKYDKEKGLSNEMKNKLLKLFWKRITNDENRVEFSEPSINIYLCSMYLSDIKNNNNVDFNKNKNHLFINNVPNNGCVVLLKYNTNNNKVVDLFTPVVMSPLLLSKDKKAFCAISQRCNLQQYKEDFFNKKNMKVSLNEFNGYFNIFHPKDIYFLYIKSIIQKLTPKQVNGILYLFTVLNDNMQLLLDNKLIHNQKGELIMSNDGYLFKCIFLKNNKNNYDIYTKYISSDELQNEYILFIKEIKNNFFELFSDNEQYKEFISGKYVSISDINSSILSLLIKGKIEHNNNNKENSTIKNTEYENNNDIKKGFIIEEKLQINNNDFNINIKFDTLNEDSKKYCISVQIKDNIYLQLCKLFSNNKINNDTIYLNSNEISDNSIEKVMNIQNTILNEKINNNIYNNKKSNNNINDDVINKINIGNSISNNTEQNIIYNIDNNKLNTERRTFIREFETNYDKEEYIEALIKDENILKEFVSYIISASDLLDPSVVIIMDSIVRSLPKYITCNNKQINTTEQKCSMDINNIEENFTINTEENNKQINNINQTFIMNMKENDEQIDVKQSFSRNIIKKNEKQYNLINCSKSKVYIDIFNKYMNFLLDGSKKIKKAKEICKRFYEYPMILEDLYGEEIKKVGYLINKIESNNKVENKNENRYKIDNPEIMEEDKKIEIVHPVHELYYKVLKVIEFRKQEKKYEKAYAEYQEKKK